MHNTKLIFTCENDLSKPIGGTAHVKELLISLTKLWPDTLLIAPEYKGHKVSVDPTINSIFIKTCNIRIIKWLYFYFVNTLKIINLYLKSPKIVIYSREMIYNILLSIITRILKIPLFIEINGVILKEMKDLKYPNWIYKITKICEKFILSKADKIVTVSDKIQEILIKDLNLSPYKFVTIPNGTNPDHFCPLDKMKCREDLGLPKDSFIIGFIGSCYPYHDVDTLIKSIPRLKKNIPEIKIVIVGDGASRVYWESIAKNLKVTEQIIFTGYTPTEKANLYINSFDICYAGYKKETFGFALKILDYLACNKPVITSNIPAITKYFKEMEFFKFIEPENEESIIKSVLEIYHSPIINIKEHREFVINNYTWEHTARKIIKLIEETICAA